MTPSERAAALATKLRPSAFLLTHNGITQSIGKWAKNRGISPSTLRYRLETGWTVRDALETPPDPDKSRKARSAYEWDKRHL